MNLEVIKKLENNLELSQNLIVFEVKKWLESLLSLSKF